MLYDKFLENLANLTIIYNLTIILYNTTKSRRFY